jgi:hypothetical protein
MNSSKLFTMSHADCLEIISAGAKFRTVLVQGHMGWGKSAMLGQLANRFPSHAPVYFDCTTKSDAGDLMIPKLMNIDGSDFVRYATNEELGVHLNKPLILLIDEFGKANQSVKNGLLRLMYERKIGSITLHPDSLIFATTNLGAEGVGDLLKPHERDRFTTLTLRKPVGEEWIPWGLDNGVNVTVLSWAKQTPQIFQSFEDVERPDDNPYIYHPKSTRRNFVTGRSLEAAGKWLDMSPMLSQDALQAALMGTVGDAAALDLMAYSKLLHELPSIESIKQHPEQAKIPSSMGAVCMVVFRSLSSIDHTWADAWMTYLNRLDRNAQALFCSTIQGGKFSPERRSAVMQTVGYRDWAMANNHIFHADKK